MAFNKDQNEPKVPISNVEKRFSSDLLPRFYRTKGNKKFLQATLDQLIQPGTVKKLNGYIGRKTAKAVESNDIFLSAANKEREDYQFEPAAVVQDYLGNTTFFKDYIDYINQIDVLNGDVKNHSRLNKQEFYSWNPHICWDKFVNYQQYYWLPFGPNTITVLGQQKEIQSTFTVKGVDETDNVAYLFTPNGLTRNPTIRLFRGQKYTFDIDAQGHPFSIKDRRTGGTLDRYTKGVSNYAVENGSITFDVPVDAPDVLFYVSENAVDTGGVFHILDIEENTVIDLEKDFLGKKDYIVPNGTAQGLKISNGMKLRFGGQVTPEVYGTGEWYVEGVGTAIKLVNTRSLEVRTSYNVETNILFDDTPFDQLPFGDSSVIPIKKDYVTINRASIDNNAWSRYNRWFHQDVIKVSAEVNGQALDLDQTARAIRPIIEFVPDMKLYNHGTVSKKNIDVIDNYTTDVFSTIEGSIGYNIDGIDLTPGMRVLFNADTDVLVKNKIYKVNFITVDVSSKQLTFIPETAVNLASNRIAFDSEHGLRTRDRVIYLNNGNESLASLVNREVYWVKVIDTFTIELHATQNLNTQLDLAQLSSGTHKLEVFAGSRTQITLVEDEDSLPNLNETVSVNFGITDQVAEGIQGNQGQTYWFNGSTWKLAQLKTSVNQPPLFDIFDNDGVSFSDTSISAYDGSSFSGTKIFSYKIGSGTADKELGFALTYQNINNIGDIVFEFNLLTDSFSYKSGTDVLEKSTDVGFLKLSKSLEIYEYENAWKTSLIDNVQPIVRVFKNHEYNGKDLPFPIDVFDDKDNLSDLEVRVYVNGKRLNRDQYSIETGVVRKHLLLASAVTSDDLVTLRCFASQPKNQNGYYEFPINLQNNPLNNNLEKFTLGQVIDHVDSIIDNINTFTGMYPGSGNLRDIGNLSAFGTRFVQHSGPMNLSLYHLCNDSSNIVQALDKARNDYGKFKRSFIVAATESGIDAAPRIQLDYIMQEINKNKPKSSSYFLSDMIGYTASNRLEYTILDSRTKTYPLTEAFNLSNLSNKAVYIYLNGEQLVHGKDYIFGDDVFFEILTDLQEGDLLEAYEYQSTDGCFCPQTPTKLGLYPKFEPKIFVDTTYRPQVVSYDVDQSDSKTTFYIGEYNINILDSDLKVYVDGNLQNLDDDYNIVKNGRDALVVFISDLSPGSFVEIYVPTVVIQGHDGSITVAFDDYRDDLILELEKRIFNNIKVEYDTNVFDIFNIVPGYSRTTPWSRIEFDKVLSKYFFQWTVNVQEDYTKHIGYNFDDKFTYNYRGNYTPDAKDVPAGWRGVYRWVLDTDRPHLTPWECLGFSVEPLWWQEVYGPVPYTSDNQLLWDDIKQGIIREPGVPVRRNPKFAKTILANGLPVNDQGDLISPWDSGFISGTLKTGDDGYFVFGDYSTVESAWRKSSYMPFALLETALLLQPNYVLGCGLDRSRIIRNINNQLVYKDTGLRLRLEDVVIPSTATRNNDRRQYTAGLINYIVDYLTSENTDKLDQYALDLSTLTTKMSSKLGSFTSKPKYKLILDSKTPSSSGGVFVPEENYYVDLNVSSAVKKVIYSGVVITKFDDGFEVRGYNFENPYFNFYPYVRDDRVIRIGGISESYVTWIESQFYVAGKIVRYNNQFYRVKTNHTSGSEFQSQYYVRLAELPVSGGREAILRKTWDKDELLTVAYGTKLTTIQEVVDLLQGYGEYLTDQGFVFDDFNNDLATVTNWKTSIKEFLFWTTQNWAPGAAISLSPAANKLIFNSPGSVVDDITSPFRDYSVYRVDGQKLEPEFIAVYRKDNEFTIEPENTTYGIFGVTLYLVQKEHIVVLDNTTLFNDTIYDPEAGYRQDRVKVLGYVTSNWNGGFEIPGFIYDRAVINAWEPWTDYKLGDIIKHKEFYYSAKKFLVGTETFNDDDWVLLEEKPKAELLPNWDYKAEQFTDFYDLDTDNFDSSQQKIAQHLIGYQKRQYLENIIQNDVSQYKFYQGMIIEKGTQNVLNKLFDVLSADGQESLTFDEEWAFRVGEYGALDTFEEVEFILDESRFRPQPQPFEIVNVIDPSVNDYVYRQRASDVYIKPLNFTTNVWPTTDKAPYLRTPGFVRADNVKTSLDSIENLVSESISSWNEGDYLWAGFENKNLNLYQGWNVYRMTKSGYNIISVDYTSKIATVTCNRTVSLAVGDIIGIKNTKNLDGFYKIASVVNNVFTFVADISNWSEFNDRNTAILYKFVSQRTNNIDNANSIIPSNIKPKELIWVDDNGQDNWAVYQHNLVYRKAEIENLDPEVGMKFGLSTAIDSTGNIAVVADLTKISIFEKGSNDNSWKLVHRIYQNDTIATSATFGAVMRFSRDAKWLAISAPDATGVKLDFNGIISSPGSITYDDITSGFVSTTSSAATVPDGTAVRFSDIGTTGLSTSTTYYVFNSTSTGFNISSSYANAVSASPIAVTTSPTIGWSTPYPVATFLSTQITSIETTELLTVGMTLSKLDGSGTLASSPVIQSVDDDNTITVSFGSGIFSAGTIEVRASGFSNQGYISLYTRTTNGEYSFVNYLRSPNQQTNEFFGNAIDFAKTTSGYRLVVGAEGSSTDRGRVYIYDLNSLSDWELTQELSIPANVDTDDLFGHDVSLSADGSILAVSAPGFEQEITDLTNTDNSGKVFVYSYDSSYILNSTYTATSSDDSERFGETISLSASGKFLAVGASLMNVSLIKDTGVVYVRNLITNSLQIINSRRRETNEQFGYDLEFMNDDKSLVIFSKNADYKSLTTFDSNSTLFDSKSLRLVDTVVNTGTVDIYDRYNNIFIYGETLENTTAPNANYGFNLSVGSNTILVPAAEQGVGSVYSYIKSSGTYSWTELHTELPKIDVSKIKKVFLYNRVTSKIVTYLDIVDPVQGKIPGPADQEIRYKSYFDPAVYSSGPDSLNIDDGMNWTSEQVGMLWWDLTRAKFLDTQSGDVTYRTTIWNHLYDTASIDIYEWVETTLTPAQWNKLADTEKGIAQGISGWTKYGDDVYSVKRRYDPFSKSFKDTYYFWVGNKKIVPNVQGRSLSASNVSKLIADPAGYGYSCIGFNGTNSLTLINLEKHLQGTDVVLSIQYWLSDYKESNYHSQWKLLSTNRNTVIPALLETKWFHSLVGKDSNDRVVPDITLPLKQKYGIEFKPRQSMFVNRVEALKQYVERVNSVLKTKLIADDFNLTNLEQYEPLPSIVSGTWDVIIDIDAELTYVSTTIVKTATVELIILDGKISAIVITDPGYGYGTLRPVDENNPTTWYGPDLKFSGNGIGAKVKTILDVNGRVVDTVIVNPGEGYGKETFAYIRNFSVLVKNDETSNGAWSIYSWNFTNSVWEKLRSQSYDVRKYWEYLDWYETGYNQFIKIDHLVENTYELVTTSIEVGSVAKVKNVGTGGWLLLEKYNNLQTIDYTQNFKVIGRENGTIRFLDSLYRFDSNVLGFDGPLYDSDVYDNSPTVELKIILNAVRNDLLIDELYVEYLKLFFSSVRYAVHEQTFIDWAFKTSFVKSMHNVGPLKQKITYNSDNLEFFEEYIKEVKPFRTKVREYVSNYSNIEPSQTVVTDFDILPVINEDLTVTPLSVYINDQAQISASSDEIDLYPWKNWADTVGFEILSIEIIDQGSGYITRPIVEIFEEYNGIIYKIADGTSAEARAYISNGRVNRIELVNGGSRWVKAPIINIRGGLSETGTQAKAIAIIGNGVPRSNFIKIKFDRISKVYEISELTETESFVGTGSRTEFPLRWSPDIKIGNSYVTVGGVDLLRGEYTLETVESTSRGYTSYSGMLKFDSAPAEGVTITIEYNKNFEHLSATDRINFYYNPITGQIGKDLSQLMTGIDYGGVNVTGVDFLVSVGWDALPWFTDAWDSSDPEYNDYIVTVSTVTYEFKLPYVPEIDEEINVYVSRFDNDPSSLTYKKHLPAVRIDDPDFATVNQTNDDALMKTFVGDGEVDIINLPEEVNLQTYVIVEGRPITYGDRVIFRKSTSDGSYNPQQTKFDTQLTGGDLAYSTATGFSPDDIILDGDDFITPATSHAPEEVVPGQVTDAVAIKVYHRPSGGCPKIMFHHYLGDGSTTEFKIGQYFPNDMHVIVKVDGQWREMGVIYSIDYKNNTVKFVVPPSIGAQITILSVGFNSANILDTDYFISDGTTTEYITRAAWLPTISSTVLVDGQAYNYVIFSTDEQYTNIVGQTWRSRAGIRFQVPPPEGSVITYILDTSEVDQTASIIRKENIAYISGIQTYQLDNQVGVNLPLEQNVIVKQGQGILKPPSANYFTIGNNQFIYELDDHKYLGVGVTAGDIKVYKDYELLNPGSDYSLYFDYTGPVYSILQSSIILSGGGGYDVGDVLEADGGSFSSTGAPAKFEVVRVNSITGAIQIIEVISGGIYSLPPDSTFDLIGGSGTGASMTATFEIIQDVADIRVEISNDVYQEGSLLIAVVNSGADYFIENGEITFVNTYSNGTAFEIISFYNHNILGIERTVDELIPSNSIREGVPEYYELVGKLGGSFRLRNTAVSGDYVWVIKNGELLMHGVDYILEEDYITIKLATYLTSNDNIQIIAFTNTVVHDSFAYMQFKDILNRVHYKRLNKDKSTRLARDLNQFDKDIVVDDASKLDDPDTTTNVPGIIEINGERIEYFTKIGNVLSRITRGTLGTGTPQYHSKDSLVQCIGASETIPYSDTETVNVYISDGVSNIIPISSIPVVQDVNGQAVIVDLEVFVAGYRLKKHEYQVYSNEEYPDSPEGDVTFLKEFDVPTLTDGFTGAAIRLAEVPAMGVKVTIVKKQGKVWNDLGHRLAKSRNPIADFLNEAPANWVESYLDKYENRVISGSGDPLQTGDGQPLEY